MRPYDEHNPRSGKAGMAVGEGYRQFVLDQLSELGRVSARRLFGGVGLYLNDVIFGLIFEDQLYFKTDAASRIEYQKRGMQGFRTQSKERAQDLRMSYFTVPAEVLEDPEILAVWARRALSVQGPKKPRQGP
jgi:DNA transformation protein